MCDLLLLVSFIKCKYLMLLLQNSYINTNYIDFNPFGFLIPRDVAGMEYVMLEENKCNVWYSERMTG